MGPAIRGQLRPSTHGDYRWRLERHLLPFFAEYPLDAITYDAVERYIAAKLAEREPLSARSINMTVTLLGAILETAVERDLIPRNPARGKRRRVREHAPRRTYLDTAEQIAALLDAAGKLDGDAREDRRHVRRRAIIATLVFAGLRIGELCALRWRDVDLAAGWLHVGEAKTDAGRRRVKLRGALRDELAEVRAQAGDADPDAYVFATSSGRRPGPDNVRNRVLAPADKLASSDLVERGFAPLPERLTPHSLRRTFASVLYALGEDPGVVMDEMGHTDPALALAIYRQAMRRDDGDKDRLRTLVEGSQLANIGQRDASSTPTANREGSRLERNKPRVSGAFLERARQDLNLRPLAPEATPLLAVIVTFSLQIGTKTCIPDLPISAEFGPIRRGLAPWTPSRCYSDLRRQATPSGQLLIGRVRREHGCASPGPPPLGRFGGRGTRRVEDTRVEAFRTVRRGSAGTRLGFEALLLADRRGRQSRLATSLIAGSRAALSKTRGRALAGRVSRRAPMAPRAGREVDRGAKRFDGKVRSACAAEPRWRLDRRRHERGSNPGSGIHDWPANWPLLGRSGGQSVANPGGLPWLLATATGTDAAVGSTSSGAARLCGSTESQRTWAKSTTLGPSRRWPVTRSEAWTASAAVALRR